MTLLLHELKMHLLNSKNPDDILELLNISSEELLERFTDKIEDRYEELAEEYEEGN